MAADGLSSKALKVSTSRNVNASRGVGVRGLVLGVSGNPTTPLSGR